MELDSAFHRPERSGLFEAMAEDRLAGGCGDAGADKQVLFAELGMFMRAALGAK